METQKLDSQKLKKGDIVFHTRLGEVPLNRVDAGKVLPFHVHDVGWIRESGHENGTDAHPTLFLNLKECSRYFSRLSDMRTFEIHRSRSKTLMSFKDSVTLP